MWVGTLEGFYSAVEHENDTTKVVVRARVRAHLVELQRYVATGRIFASAHRDYQFRCVMPKPDFAAGLAKMVIEGLTYKNYKKAVGERDPHRAHVLGRVWAALRDLHRGDEHHDDGSSDAWGVPLRDGTER